MVAGVMYVDVEGLYAALKKGEHAHPAGNPLLLIQDKRVADLCSAAARLGVKKGMPLSQARHFTGKAVEVELEDENYDQRRDALLKWGGSVTPRVEVENRMQIFLQLASNDSPRKIFSSLLDQLFPHRGHRFFAGVGANKLVAKIAVMLLQKDDFQCPEPASFFPPDGDERGTLLTVAEGEEERFLRNLPVSFLWPFPRKVIKRLEKLGVRVVGQLKETPDSLLRQHFGLRAQQLLQYCRGEYPQPVAADYPPAHRQWEGKIFSSSFSELENLLAEAAKNLALQLKSAGLVAGLLYLRAGSESGRSIEASRILPDPIRDESRIYWMLLPLASREKISEIMGSGEDPMHLQVKAAQLQQEKPQQVNLFWEAETKNNRNTINEITRKLQKKHSNDVVYWGEGAVCSRKEKMFAFWDPFRQSEGGQK